MTTMIIDDNSVQAKEFINFVRTLPFTTIVEPAKKSFKEAVAECNGITVDEFIDELDALIEKWPDNA